MDRGRILAIITGAISIFIAVLYLVLVQILDFRGEMLPAPIEGSGLQHFSPGRGTVTYLESPDPKRLSLRILSSIKLKNAVFSNGGAIAQIQ